MIQIFFNSRRFCIMALIAIFALLVFLVYGNLSKKSQINLNVQVGEKQENDIKETVHQYQDCLKMNQEWSTKYFSQHKILDDLYSRLDSIESERQKSEAQLKESKGRVELLEGQVKSLTAQNVAAAAASGEKDSPDAKETKEVVQNLRQQLAELQQKLKAAAAPPASS